jgi:sugar lactone lactonase YvrE
VDAAGDLAIGDAQNNMLRRIGGFGTLTVTTVSGNTTPGYRNGAADVARFNLTADVLIRATGDYLIADANNHTIRLVSADGFATNWAGNGTAGYANGMRQSARFIRPTGLATDRSGTVHIAERGAHRIRRVLSNGSVMVTAGSTSASGQAGFVDGGGTAARFNEPDGLAVTTAGTIHVADRGNHAIRSITGTGYVTTMTGSGQPGYTDGPASDARFNQPAGICVDTQGTLYVADSGNHRIRKVETIRDTLTLGLMTSRGLGLTVTGATNATYRLEASVDLDSWTPVELVVAAGGRAQVLDPAATNNAHRFYRAIPSP